MKKDKRVLVIDDEDYVLHMVTEFLEDEGYTVITANHPGLGASRATFVDCIVLDLSLTPESLEGSRIMAHIWEDAWSTVPIIVFSGVIGTSNVDEILEQVESFCGKGRSVFRFVHKKEGVESLVGAVNDWYETTLHSSTGVAG